MKLSPVQKDAVVCLLNGREPACDWLTFAALAEAGLIDDERELTEEGRRAALEASANKERARHRRNARSRARNAAYASLGMRRTPYGWE